MRDFLDMFDGEKREQVAALRDTLNEDKKHVSDELNYYKSVARDVKRAKRRVESAQTAYEKRESAKNASKLDDANDELTAALNSFGESEAQIKQHLETVRSDYADIAALYRGRKADRFMDAFEKYNTAVLTRIIDIQAETETDSYFESNEEEEVTPMAIPEIPVANGTPNPAAAPAQAAPAPAPAYATPAYQYPQYIPVPMPMPYSYPPQQPAAEEKKPQTPNIAPVSIDVSPMLEKALEATMQKFVAAFDKRIEKFVNEHPVNIPTGSAPASAGVSAASGEIATLEGAVLEDEQALIEKLTTAMEALKTLTETVDALSARVADIAAKQAAANDMMKQTNDIQRQTLREQKGIQVGQRVINQDQAVVTAEQAALQDQQKGLLENQQALVEGQQAMAEAHKLVAENQAAVDEALRASAAVQKELLSAAQAINASNAKALDVQKDVAERQSATLDLQKEALTAQRQMLRDQKNMVEKQKALGGDAPKKKAKADDADEDNA